MSLLRWRSLEEEDQLHSLKNKVQLINKNVIGKKSREVYIGKQIAFLNWLDETHPSLLSPQFRETAERDSKGVLKRAFVKQLLIDAIPPAPVLLEKIDAEVISLFVASLKKTDGTAVGSSTHNTTRSSLRDLFRAYKCMDLAESMNTSLSNFKGLKRTTAQAQQRRWQDTSWKDPVGLLIVLFPGRKDVTVFIVELHFRAPLSALKLELDVSSSEYSKHLLFTHGVAAGRSGNLFRTYEE